MSEDDSDTKSTSSEESSSQQRPRKKASSTSSSSEKSRSTQGSSSGARRSSSSSSEGSSSRSKQESSSPRRRTRLSAVGASKKAIEQFGTLTGRAPESVVGVKKSDEGWNVTLEVVEARRVPDTSDLLAEYDIDLDGSGELLSYERINRYVRGRADS
ncbi:gas vesicle protein GvpO [Nesterenkonia haasae]|uniref:gas vesicle protein GvpO n=1 Tax=Nesterenkonia haasae TaxID=2587813 RepID=UPI0013912C4B|nr:gas vesicle protein [Nesterenkonia haasae]NDK33164.1 gas vesicle protein [Nesterenkonia haasae]